VIAAFVFIFIPTIGEYVTPSLVGGNRGFMFGNAIADLFGPGFDWTTGAVLSLFLFVVVLLLTVLFARFLSIRRLSAA
jgi:spermidine/putrescine transport system permease protein